MLAATLAGLAAMPLPAIGREGVQFGLTAVVVRENIAFFERWGRYLSERLGRPVIFVRRRSYREIMELLETGELDFAWICGYPFVRRREPEYLDLVAVPIFEGAPLYRSYVIVHRDSTIRSLEDLKGKVFAYSDPDSNSGYLVPRATLARIRLSPDALFRISFFTYNHAETVEAVANRVADAGAVDSYVWEYLHRTNPALTARTRILHRSETFGFPPIVGRRGGDKGINAAMRAALLTMHEDADGKSLLAQLALDGFGAYEPSLFDEIRQLARRLSDPAVR